MSQGDASDLPPEWASSTGRATGTRRTGRWIPEGRSWVLARAHDGWESQASTGPPAERAASRLPRQT